MVELAELAGADHHGDPGLVEGMSHLAPPVDRHDRNDDRPDPLDRDVGHHELGPVRQLDRDPLPAPHPEFPEPGPEPIRLGAEIGVVEADLTVVDREMVRLAVGPPVEVIGHRVVAPPASSPEPSDVLLAESCLGGERVVHARGRHRCLHGSMVLSHFEAEFSQIFSV